MSLLSGYLLAMEAANITVRRALVSELSPAELAACKRLTLKDGLMRGSLNIARGHRQDRSSRVVLIESEGRLLAWALVYRVAKEPTEAHFYVRSSERRRGLGTRLMQEVRRCTRRPQVHPHDSTSQSFFARFDGVEVVY